MICVPQEISSSWKYPESVVWSKAARENKQFGESKLRCFCVEVLKTSSKTTLTRNKMRGS
jgi:hypothetical protein